MKPIQKKPSNGTKKAPENQWQMPEKAQIIVTPGAEKNFENAALRGEEVRVVTDRRPVSKKEITKRDPKKAADKKMQKKKEPLSFKDAALAELKDRAQIFRLNIQVNSEEIIRAAICTGLLVLFALLQTTFFARFAPFGAVPDLMLIFVLAIGVYEGEKWGSVVGLISAFVIQALGGSGNEPELLSLVYMPVGCSAGLLTKYYLSNTFPVKVMYVGAASFIKAIITVITASMALKAETGDIILRIAIPEYFSTVVLSALPFFTVWLCFKHFHKTRAERTDPQQS